MRLGNDMQIIMAVTNGRRPDRPNEPISLEDELWTLISQCWEADPKVRPHIRRATEKVSDWSDHCVYPPSKFNLTR
jgi:hypothetical protein